MNHNEVYQDFVKYHADGAFWAMIHQGCGFAEEEPDPGRLAIHLLLTAITRTMRQEYLAGFHTAEAKDIWKEYTEGYYQMDTYYRLFHLSFQKSRETSNILLDWQYAEYLPFYHKVWYGSTAST